MNITNLRTISYKAYLYSSFYFLLIVFIIGYFWRISSEAILNYSSYGELILGVMGLSIGALTIFAIISRLFYAVAYIIILDGLYADIAYSQMALRTLQLLVIGTVMSSIPLGIFTIFSHTRYDLVLAIVLALLLAPIFMSIIYAFISDYRGFLPSLRRGLCIGHRLYLLYLALAIIFYLINNLVANLFSLMQIYPLAHICRYISIACLIGLGFVLMFGVRIKMEKFTS